MSVSNLESLRHPPEVVVSFIRRLIDGYRADPEVEQRVQRREPISIPVVVQPLGPDYQPAGEIFQAVTKDVSTGGIGVICSEPVESKYVQLGIANHDGEEMSLLAQVKHCTPCGKLFHIGAQFVVDWSLWRDNDTQGTLSRGKLSRGSLSDGQSGEAPFDKDLRR